MKRVFLLMLCLGISASVAYAETTPPAVDNAKLAEKRKKIEEKKAELNGSEWEVNLSSPGGGSDKDIITFQNGQVRMQSLLNKKFVPTNYTITVEEGSESAIWETMQTSSDAKEGVVFVRGEWKGDQMHGVISQQIEGGATRDYNFTTAKKTAVPATVEEKKEEKKEEKAVEAATQAPDETASAEAVKTEEEAPKPAPKASKKSKKV